MQHAWKHVERPGGSHTALDGKKVIKSEPQRPNNGLPCSQPALPLVPLQLNHTPSMKQGNRAVTDATDTQREAPAHRGASWTRAHTRPHAGQGRQKGQTGTPQRGQTTRETTKPAQAQRGAQKPRETASPQEHKDSTITRAPQGNTFKEAHDRQGGGGQHRQSN